MRCLFPHQTVLVDAPYGAIGGRERDFEQRRGAFDGQLAQLVGRAEVAGFQRLGGCGVMSGGLLVLFLAIVELAEDPFRGLFGFGLERVFALARYLVRELDVAPIFRQVDVDDAGRGPHPVVFADVLFALDGDFHVFAILGLHGPFDAREVHAELVAGLRTLLGAVAHLVQRAPGEEDLDAPGFVRIAWVVERAVHVDAHLLAQVFPVVDDARAVAVRLAQVEVPVRPVRVDFIFQVIVRRAHGVDKDLEVVLFEDDAIVLRLVSPHVRLLHEGGEIHAVLVVGHLGAGLEMGGGTFVAFDVHKVRRPGDSVPFRQFTVHFDFARRLIADVGGRVERRHGRKVDTRFVCRLRLGRAGRQHCAKRA